jgi:chromosome partitioning protein
MVVGMATILTIANQKGGPGKTTTAINVAGELQSAGYRVVVVDVDPQATLSKWNRLRTKQSMEPFTVVSVSQGLLDDTLNDLRANTGVDVAVVDCPGNIHDLTTRAVEHSDAVLCPVRATFFDVDATREISRFITAVRMVHPEIRFMLFINAKHGSRNLDKSARENLVRIFQKSENTHVLETEIPDAAAIAEFGGTGMTVAEYSPKSPGARLYKKLTKEVVECLAASPVSV